MIIYDYDDEAVEIKLPDKPITEIQVDVISGCCGNKNLKELRNMYLYMPKYWERLKEFQSRTDRPFRRDGKTIFDLEKRFKEEAKNELRH